MTKILEQILDGSDLRDIIPSKFESRRDIEDLGLVGKTLAQVRKAMEPLGYELVGAPGSRELRKHGVWEWYNGQSRAVVTINMDMDKKVVRSFLVKSSKFESRPNIENIANELIKNSEANKLRKQLIKDFNEDPEDYKLASSFADNIVEKQKDLKRWHSAEKGFIEFQSAKKISYRDIELALSERGIDVKEYAPEVQDWVEEEGFKVF